MKNILLKRNLKRIKPVAAKRKKQLEAYRDIKDKFLMEHPICEIKFPGCQKIATQIHHNNQRNGDRLLDTEGFIAACGFCHRSAHDKSLKIKNN